VLGLDRQMVMREVSDVGVDLPPIVGARRPCPQLIPTIAVDGNDGKVEHGTFECAPELEQLIASECTPQWTRGLHVLIWIRTRL